jgi:hypothetical protein
MGKASAVHWRLVTKFPNHCILSRTVTYTLFRVSALRPGIARVRTLSGSGMAVLSGIALVTSLLQIKFSEGPTADEYRWGGEE